MLQPADRPPRNPLLFFAEILVFALGIIGGLIFVAMVGMYSAEF